MNEADRRTLVRHGAWVLLIGFVAGLPLGMEIVAELGLGPDALAIDMPGETRGWRMAHLEGLLNGMLLLLVAGVGHLIHVGDRGRAWIVWGLLVCAWGNTFGAWIAPLSSSRGLSYTGLDWNSLAYVLFTVAVVGAFGAVIAVVVGARARSGDSSE